MIDEQAMQPDIFCLLSKYEIKCFKMLLRCFEMLEMYYLMALSIIILRALSNIQLN